MYIKKERLKHLKYTLVWLSSAKSCRQELDRVSLPGVTFAADENDEKFSR